MTRKRVTKEEKQQRHEWAMKQIDKGVGFSELAPLISETWGLEGPLKQFQGGRYQRSPFFSFQTLRGFMVSRPCNT